MNLSDITIFDYTTPLPVTANINDSYHDVCKLMDENQIRHLPVLNDYNEPVGVISQRDLHLLRNISVTDLVFAKDIMSKDPYSVLAHENLETVALEMSRRKIGSALVQNKDRVIGIFTITDALNALVEIVRGDYTKDNSAALEEVN